MLKIQISMLDIECGLVLLDLVFNSYQSNIVTAAPDVLLPEEAAHSAMCWIKYIPGLEVLA